MNLDNFFFLRPLWLLLLLPLVGLLSYLLHGNKDRVSTPWQHLVDPHLLKHLVVQADSDKPENTRTTVQYAALGIALMASTISLAGPTWQRNELPSYKAQTPVVMVLSLAQSMNATDVSPNRLTRAVHKVRDILQRNKGGDLALVVYSDQAFAATPLTSDAKLISDMLPELSTSLMPVLGNRLDLAIERATALLTQATARQGQILLLADDAGAHPELAKAAAQKATDAGYTVSVLGVGTETGAALQSASGTAITNQAGQGYTTRLATADLSEIANAGEGRFTSLTADATDLDSVLADTSPSGLLASQSEPTFHADTWKDMGYYLLVVPLLLAPLAFRKNLLLAALPLVLALNLSVGTPNAQAADDQTSLTGDDTPVPASTQATTDKATWSKRWNHLWLTPDQQADRDFKADNFEQAANTFNDITWKASALYRDGQFEQAAQLYADKAATFDNSYNQGNALAMAGQLEQALSAYDQALKLKPDDEDAVFNRELVAKLLEQQKQEEEQQQQQDQQQQHADGEQPQDQQQQQADGEQSQDQQQQQADGEQSQDQQQQQADGEQSQEQPQNQQADAENTAQPTESADGKNAFRQAMDELLSGNGDTANETKPEQAPDADKPLAAHSYSEKEQAIEQQLRVVPDDPSGLLRARIRQHYAQQRAGRG